MILLRMCSMLMVHDMKDARISIPAFSVLGMEFINFIILNVDTTQRESLSSHIIQ